MTLIWDPILRRHRRPHQEQPAVDLGAAADLLCAGDVDSARAKWAKVQAAERHELAERLREAQAEVRELRRQLHEERQINEARKREEEGR